MLPRNIRKAENFILIIDKTAALKCVTTTSQFKIFFDGIPSIQDKNLITPTPPGM